MNKFIFRLFFLALLFIIPAVIADQLPQPKEQVAVNELDKLLALIRTKVDLPIESIFSIFHLNKTGTVVSHAGSMSNSPSHERTNWTVYKFLPKSDEHESWISHVNLNELDSDNQIIFVSVFPEKSQCINPYGLIKRYAMKKIYLNKPPSTPIDGMYRANIGKGGIDIFFMAKSLKDTACVIEFDAFINVSA